ncbi:MAG: sugar phosphate nucleotidyltransferase [Verrucomicrobiota bacterium]
MKDRIVSNPTLVIMAAGMGSRYGSLKQMDSVGPNGEKLLEYSIYDAIRAGFGKAVFVIRRDFAVDFKAQIGNRFEGKIDVQYAFQSLEDLPAGFTAPAGRSKPWGTAQAIFACRELVQEPFAVQNADDFYGAEAYNAMASALRQMPEGESCMIGYRLRKTLSPNGYVSRGLCQTQAGYLAGIVEHTRIEKHATGVIQSMDGDHVTELSGDEPCSMNFWGFHPCFFASLEEKFTTFLQQQGDDLKSEWFIPSVVDEMITLNQTRVRVIHCESHWFGVTYAEDKPMVMAQLKELHRQGHYPQALW